MSVAVELSPCCSSPLRDSIRDLRAGYQSLSECLEQALAECEARSSELAECRRQLAQAHRNTSACEQQIAERTRAESALLSRCATLKKQLESEQLEHSKTSDRLSRAQAESAQCNQRLEIQIEQNKELRELVARLEYEREVLGGELAQLRAQFAPMADCVAEAARLRGELASAQADVTSLKEQIAAGPSDAALREQQAAAQLERQQLESELDALRHRGAELSEALAEQQRLTAEQRERWSEELRKLRRAVERQSEVLAQGASPVAGRAEVANPTPRQGDLKHGEIVIDSLLAQFETLQKNKGRNVGKA